MKEVYLLLGSNEGNKLENIKAARRFINAECGSIKKSSSFYETAAWGLQEQQGFINQAIMIETGFGPEDLLLSLKNIEKKMGRVETVKWGPRVIDIDILFYAGEIINTPALKVPHPLMQDRRFTLVPLNEIAGSFIHPVLKKNVSCLLEECSDTLPVNKLSQ